MPILSAKAGLGLAAAFAALAGGAAAITDAIDERDDIRRHAAAITGGDPERGKRAFVEHGCGGCHSIDSVRRAKGKVGPALDDVGLRVILAGRLENRPDNLQRWIRNPQSVSPGTAMPNLDVGERDARDIAAFLYTRTGD